MTPVDIIIRAAVLRLAQLSREGGGTAAERVALIRWFEVWCSPLCADLARAALAIPTA